MIMFTILLSDNETGLLVLGIIFAVILLGNLILWIDKHLSDRDN